jgi:hypothetical protein
MSPKDVDAERRSALESFVEVGIADARVNVLPSLVEI